MSPLRAPRMVAAGVLAALLATATLVALVPAVPSGAAVAASAQDAPVTTSTLPSSNGEIGNIIPKPNSGVEPASPSDRGGWQQLTLFLLICATIIAMGVAVWLRSRTVRQRQRAAGYDRVADARAHGGDVRAPRPPGIVD